MYILNIVSGWPSQTDVDIGINPFEGFDFQQGIGKRVAKERAFRERIVKEYE